MLKKIVKYGVFGFSLIFLWMVFSNLWIVSTTEDRIFQDIAKLPSSNVALVLGTSKSTVGGGVNSYFENRVDAAARLYKAGKVNHILVSGDNRTKYYNEPQDMYEALRKRGVPDSAITLDYAGLRTLDSVVRCIKIFGQDNFTIISQEFHGYRALFIADYYGVNANVYAANDPENINQRVSLRELVARQLAIFDLYILNKQPRFMGEKVPLSSHQP